MALGAGLRRTTTTTTTTSGRGKFESTSSNSDITEDGPAVPSFFVCPISLELMRDPVTLPTGMTYDRASIEKWLGLGHNTCPTTNQVLERDADLIPNHTLRRLIQSWCVANQTLPTTNPQIPTTPICNGFLEDTVAGLLHTIRQGSSSLRKLRTLAEESERHRKCISEAGAVRILAATMGMHPYSEEALGVIAVLDLSEGDKKVLSSFVTVLAAFLSTPGVTPAARVNAADVLNVLCDHDARLKVSVGDVPGVIKGLVQLLPLAPLSALCCLLAVSAPRRNRVAAVDSGAIPALVALILVPEKRNKELAFALLEVLANCAEGREAITNDGLAIPVIVKSMLGVSHRATEHAVAALWVVLSYASNRSVINTALQAGAFTNLLMLLPSECSQRAKLKARDCLKLLNEVWGSYTCRVADESNLGAHNYNTKRNHNMGHLRFSTELV